jgi:hypothetical protein
MFVLTTLAYPVVLALLCMGAGLLVCRSSGGVVPAMLLPVLGAAALIVVSQLSTYLAPLAPATPVLLVAVALVGWALGWRRAAEIASAWRGGAWQLLVGPLVYVLALAPVLLAGRPTFSSYMALADSAVHMLGADYLMRNGQSYSHLDLSNSYGAFVHSYYGTSYPSGADTWLGGSAFVLRLPTIWAFQLFTAFMVATATGPAWVLASRIGLERVWAAAATVTVTLPALVYAYELVGSVKEIVTLPLLLAMGALIADHRRWLWSGARAAIPFALLVAAGVASLGLAFGAWALAGALVLAVVTSVKLVRAKRVRGPLVEWDPVGSRQAAQERRALVELLLAGAVVLLVAAWPTWADLSGSFHLAEAIASTANPGNLHAPLRPAQLLGVWLAGSYKLVPTGVALTLTSVLVGIVFALALLGVGVLGRSGRREIAGWFASLIAVWLLLSTFATTWADAKTLMLTSPAVMLMAWAGIAAMRRTPARLVAVLAAFLLVAGVLVSDALQYNESNLAPTARYEELSSVNKRFAGRGPALFTDFDEYALYELRDLDVGGPSFAYPPPALASAAGGYGRPVVLDRIAPAALLAYPLIVTRRDPLAARPPAAYKLLWQGAYYQVWGRSPHARPALAHVTVSGSPAVQCAKLSRLASRARSRRARLVVALAPQLVIVAIPRLRFYRPPGWARAHRRILMRRPGTLRVGFRLPHAGAWDVWLKADVMRPLHIAIDGREIGSLGGQLGGNSLIANTLTPLQVRLSHGPHTISITRPGPDLGAPGDAGAAVLSGIFLTPAGTAGRPSLHAVVPARARSLCGRALQWVELMPKL